MTLPHNRRALVPLIDLDAVRDDLQKAIERLKDGQVGHALDWVYSAAAVLDRLPKMPRCSTCGEPQRRDVAECQECRDSNTKEMTYGDD